MGTVRNFQQNSYTYQNHTVSYHSEYKIPRIQSALKRLMDILASALLIIVLFPFMAVIAAAIVLNSKGGAFFKQKRIGKDMQPFTIYKFRTMEQDAEKNHKRAEVFSSKDPRLTSVGSFLRRTKIDEFPQLLNILKGDMSLVGPRPMLARHKKYYKGYKRDRFMLKPGLTGLAQVSGGVFIPLGDRAEYDVDYVRDFSILLDIKILFKTLVIIFVGERRFIRPHMQGMPAVSTPIRIAAHEKKESIA